MNELNLFALETSKPKVRVKRDALPEEPIIVNSEGQDPIAPAIPDELPDQDFNSDYDDILDLQNPDDLNPNCGLESSEKAKKRG